MKWGYFSHWLDYLDCNHLNNSNHCCSNLQAAIIIGKYSATAIKMGEGVRLTSEDQNSRKKNLLMKTNIRRMGIIKSVFTASLWLWTPTSWLPNLFVILIFMCQLLQTNRKDIAWQAERTPSVLDKILTKHCLPLFRFQSVFLAILNIKWGNS